jgi:hypothetical protein
MSVTSARCRSLSKMSSFLGTPLICLHRLPASAMVDRRTPAEVEECQYSDVKAIIYPLSDKQSSVPARLVRLMLHKSPSSSRSRSYKLTKVQSIKYITALVRVYHALLNQAVNMD